jgi:pilus assembly protein Flp/PilA
VASVPRISKSERRTIQIVRLFLRDTSGATVIEYGLIAGLVSLSIVAAARTIGLEIVRLFDIIIQAFPKH